MDGAEYESCSFRISVPKTTANYAKHFFYEIPQSRMAGSASINVTDL